MGDKIIKTNVARLLDKAKINYRIVPYQVDENNLAATHVAEQLGEDINKVFKTLVLKGDKSSYIVCMIAGDKEIDLKKAAKISGNKYVELIAMKDLLSVAGYIRGACCPIGMKKNFPTYIDEHCLDFNTIYMSAGQRGLQIEINPKDLILYTKAEVTSLISI